MPPLSRIERIDTLLAGCAENPYPLYRQLHQAGPVFVDAASRLVVAGYADCRAVLLDPDISVDPRTSDWHRQQAVDGAVTVVEQHTDDVMFIELDPPEHTRLRHLVSEVFAPRAAKVAPLVQALVDECLDRVGPLGRCDAVADFAYDIPVRVLCRLLGIREADRSQVQEWAHVISTSMDPANQVEPAEVDQVLAASRAYLDQLVAQCRRAPGDDLVSDLVRAGSAGDRLTPAEVAKAALLLLISGHETTGSLLASGVYALVTDPSLRAAVGADPERAGPLTDELLRLSPLVQFVFRYAKADVTLPSGAIVHKGGTVVVMLAAANRDPAQFPDPDAIQLDRQGPQHLSFGVGVHYCLGATLGRLQSRVALATFARRVLDPQLAVDELTRTPQSLGGLKSLPVMFRAVATPA